jgi:hypothetical protein
VYGDDKPVFLSNVILTKTILPKINRNSCSINFRGSTDFNKAVADITEFEKTLEFSPKNTPARFILTKDKSHGELKIVKDVSNISVQIESPNFSPTVTKSPLI